MRLYCTNATECTLDYTALTLLLVHETGWIATLSDDDSENVIAIIRMRNTNRRLCVGKRVITAVNGTRTVADAIRTPRHFTDWVRMLRWAPILVKWNSI
jgi:hypothetical protein